MINANLSKINDIDNIFDKKGIEDLKKLIPLAKSVTFTKTDDGKITITTLLDENNTELKKEIAKEPVAKQK